MNRKTPCIPIILYDNLQLNFKCNRCDKGFLNNQKLKNHLNRKYPCVLKNPTTEEIKLRTLFDQLQVQNDELKIKIEQLESKSSSAVSINTINTVNNITIHSYGNEDMSHITDAMFSTCFRQMQHCIETMFDMKHFSKKRKGNSNIYISNLRDSYMMIYNGGKWNKVNKAMMLEKIYYNIKDNISDGLERMREIKAVEAHLDKYFKWFVENDLNDVQEARFKKVSFKKMTCSAYNNRHYPMQIKNQMEKEIKEKEKWLN